MGVSASVRGCGALPAPATCRGTTRRDAGELAPVADVTSQTAWRVAGLCPRHARECRRKLRRPAPARTPRGRPRAARRRRARGARWPRSSLELHHAPRHAGGTQHGLKWRAPPCPGHAGGAGTQGEAAPPSHGPTRPGPKVTRTRSCPGRRAGHSPSRRTRDAGRTARRRRLGRKGGRWSGDAVRGAGGRAPRRVDRSHLPARTEWSGGKIRAWFHQPRARLRPGSPGLRAHVTGRTNESDTRRREREVASSGFPSRCFPRLSPSPALFALLAGRQPHPEVPAARPAGPGEEDRAQP